MLSAFCLVAIGVASPPLKSAPIGTESGVRVGADATLSRGNVRRFLLATRSEVTVTGNALGLAFEPQFIYGEQGQVVSERELGGRTFVYARPRSRFFGFGLGVVETSRLRRIDRRSQLGAGAGLWWSRATWLTAKATLAVLREQVDFAGSTPRGSWRTTVRTKGTLRWKPLSVEHELWWQPSLHQARDQRIHALISVAVALADRFALRMVADEDFDSITAPQRSHHNFRLTTGFVVNAGVPP